MGRRDAWRVKADLDAADDQRAAEFFAGRIWIANTGRLMAKGDRVIIQPQPNFSGWTPSGGKWKVEQPGEVTGQASNEGMQLVFDLPVGPDFELSGEIDFVASKFKGGFTAGPIFHLQQQQAPHSVLFYLNEGLAKICTDNKPFKNVEIKINKTNSGFHAA